MHMNAYECKGKFLKDGHIEIPPEIMKKLGSQQDIKLIILTEDIEENNGEIVMIKEMRGAYKGVLSSSEEFSDKKSSEKLLEERKFKL